jgi:hypothetical protein
MKIRRLFLFLFFLLQLLCAQAQDSLLKDRYYRHNYDNDFFTATDRYYTQGVYLEFIFPAFRKLLLSKTLIPLSRHALNYYGVSLSRIGYTPTSIRHFGEPVPGERPYCAVLYLSHSLVSMDPARRLRLSTRINTGFIGPNLLGEDEQIAIHTALGNILPIGWEYQVENDYVLNYEAGIEKGIFDSKCFTVTGLAEARAGTLSDDVSAGSMIRVGYMQPYFSNLGITRSKAARKFQCYLFFRGKIRAVAYNATMQGGVINHNSTYVVPASDVERLLGTASYGMVISCRKLALEYSLASITKEYKNGKNHAWGRVGVYVCF